MKKIAALGLSAALILASSSAFAFHRKQKAHLTYAPEHVLVVHKPNRDLVYIPLVTPLFGEVIFPVLNGVAVGIVSGSTMVFGGVEYVLTNLTRPPHSCVANGGLLYTCQG
ncbi:hypothetical protein [Methylocapsa palsarum]|uniref:Uncharacterized protein n=1 Tax=Methylocapsa palsarum TaxID=1612308 RepID=A0A1I3ZZW2_9HYPH|nr:hypothetical protein [Methylocapsa palsarum]SFK49628.1 hypothetical protein SAMN05444581_1092 [Methylocapsa palsarum]